MTEQNDPTTPPPAGTYPVGANEHGIGPDTDGGPNPDYVPEPLTEPGQPDLMEEIVPLPSMGLPVGYVLLTGISRPAVVQEVNGRGNLVVDLKVHLKRQDALPGGDLQESVLYCPAKTPGTWHHLPLERR